MPQLERSFPCSETCLISAVLSFAVHIVFQQAKQEDSRLGVRNPAMSEEELTGVFNLLVAVARRV